MLDLFSGIGGFSLGLERAGFETVAFCEIDKKAQKVLRKHWPNVPIFDDVSKLSAGALHERGIAVDVICGGFPCQDISVAGKGAGLEGERSGLWSEFARLIGELRPRYAIVENVSALLGRGLDRVLGDLAQIGYDAEWHCIPASAVGAPHRRDRIWIVAYPGHGGRRNVWPVEKWENTQAQWSADSDSISGSSEQSSSLAYTTSERLSKRRQSRQCESDKETPAGLVAELERCGSNVAYALRQGLERQWQIAGGTSKEYQNTGNSRWWAVEPDVGRVAHGVPGRVDRLKQLGNAVVPQIPELIGRAIMSC